MNGKTSVHIFLTIAAVQLQHREQSVHTPLPLGGVRGGRDTKPYEAISLMQEVVASAEPTPVRIAMMSFIQKLMFAFLSSFIISFTIYGFTIYYLFYLSIHYLFISIRMVFPSFGGVRGGYFLPDGLSHLKGGVPAGGGGLLPGWHSLPLSPGGVRGGEEPICPPSVPFSPLWGVRRGQNPNLSPLNPPTGEEGDEGR